VATKNNLVQSVQRVLFEKYAKVAIIRKLTPGGRQNKAGF
jgi:hypothetical protein